MEEVFYRYIDAMSINDSIYLSVINDFYRYYVSNRSRYRLSFFEYISDSPRRSQLVFSKPQRAFIFKQSV